MEKFLFSSKNVNNQCLKLLKIIKIQQTPKNVQFCKSMIVNRMKKLYDMSIEKKPEDMSQKNYIERVCKATLRDCVIGLKRAQANVMIEKEKEKEFNGASNDGTVGCNYNTLMNGDGEYITATGEIGKKMAFKGDRDIQLQSKPTSQDLEQDMYMRQREYDPRGGGNNRPQQDMNFSLDDDTTMRRRGDDRSGNQGNMRNNPQQNDPSQYFQGFEGFAGGLEQGGMGGLSDIGMLGVNPKDNNFADMNPSARLSKLESERASLDSMISSQKPQQQRFNPMNSPNQLPSNQNQNQNQNFNNNVNRRNQQGNPNQYNPQQGNPNQYNPNQFSQLGNPNQYNPNQFSQQGNPNQYNPNQYNQQQGNPNQYNPPISRAVGFPQPPPMINNGQNFF